jgi:flavin-dependent dehydrogenase
VAERLLELGWKRCLGIEACWGSDHPYARDSIFDPYGAGVQVERPRFDAFLAAAAAEAGAELALDARLLRLERRPEGWCATLASLGAEWRRCVRFVVDATGRQAVLARRIGAKRETIDRLIGLVALYDDVQPDGLDSTLLLEAVERGWWYSTPLVGAIVVAFMTDADLLNDAEGVTPESFCDRLASAPLTAARVDGFSLNRLRVRSAASSWLRPVSGEGWLAVGDAAAAHDPLAGVGLSRAVDSGIRAGQALSAALDGDREATARYAHVEALSFRAFTHQRAEIYGRERRWPSSPFWARRTE